MIEITGGEDCRKLSNCVAKDVSQTMWKIMCRVNHMSISGHYLSSYIVTDSLAHILIGINDEKQNLCLLQVVRGY